MVRECARQSASRRHGSERSPATMVIDNHCDRDDFEKDDCACVMFMGPNVIVADQCDEDQYGGDHHRDDFYEDD